MKQLSTYLSDHFAGATGALELLDDLIEKHKGEAIEAFLARLYDEIEADRRELKQLMKRLEIEESSVKKAGAWVAEKLSRAKLGIGDHGEPNLALLQSLEGLSLGITGKRSLWRLLGATAEQTTRLSDFDFARLEQRAVDQFERVEAKARGLAEEIFPAELNADRAE